MMSIIGYLFLGFIFTVAIAIYEVYDSNKTGKPITMEDVGYLLTAIPLWPFVICMMIYAGGEAIFKYLGQFFKSDKIIYDPKNNKKL